MNDILQDLKSAENAMRWDGIGRAIDEIERLREELLSRHADSRRQAEEIERLRGLLREALDNEAAVSAIGIDSETLQEYRMWDADDWNRRVREELGDE